MYSLNAPPPSELDVLQRSYAEQLDRFRSVRDRPTLVIKRFGPRDTTAVSSLGSQVEEALRDWGPMSARTGQIEVFSDPPSGPTPVLYLDVESPGIRALHEELLRRFGRTYPPIEGDRYVPHFTLARGGDRTDIAAVTGTNIERIEWTIDEVFLWDATYDRPVTRFRLPT